MRSDAHSASTLMTFDQNIMPSSVAARAATGAQNITSPGWTPQKSMGQMGNLEGGRRLAEVDVHDEKKEEKKGFAHEIYRTRTQQKKRGKCTR
jgi:hypothetical protein